jgi:hypothetical protein
MPTRTTRKTVTFSRPFSLSAIDKILPSGSYTVDTDEELIDGLHRPQRARIFLRRRPGGGARSC